MKTLKYIGVFFAVVMELQKVIKEWTEAIECAGYGPEKKADIMDALEATVIATEKVSGVDLPWENALKPLCDVFVELAVKAMKRRQEQN